MISTINAEHEVVCCVVLARVLSPRVRAHLSRVHGVPLHVSDALLGVCIGRKDYPLYLVGREKFAELNEATGVHARDVAMERHCGALLQ